jgi:hypothetical protein
VYVIATCTATVLRPTTTPDARGDKRSTYTAIATGVIAAIQESTNSVSDYATQTPRTIREISGIFPSGTDIQPLDRVRDDTHNVVYQVINTTLNRAPGHQPDLTVSMKKVSS